MLSEKSRELSIDGIDRRGEESEHTLGMEGSPDVIRVCRKKYLGFYYCALIDERERDPSN